MRTFARLGLLATAIVVSACLPRRSPGEYSTPIPMTGDEADRVDALEEESAQILDAHARCDFWLVAAAKVPRSEAGAKRYVVERTKLLCDQDPANAFRGTIEDREATVAKATVGYSARGTNFEVRAGAGVTIPTKRGECYKVALRFPAGFRPRTPVSVSFKRFLPSLGGEAEISGGTHGPGPVVMVDLTCAFTDRDGTLLLRAESRLAAWATLFVTSVSEEEIARREAEERRQWQNAEAGARAFKAKLAIEHCQRCADSLAACGSNPDCARAYVDCLREDLGDGSLGPEPCR